MDAVPAAQAASLELVDDGGFESGSTADWFNQRGGTLALTDDARSGDQALGVTGRTNTQSGPFASVTGKLELGATYRLAGKLKYTEGEPTQQFNFTFCPSNVTSRTPCSASRATSAITSSNGREISSPRV